MRKADLIKLANNPELMELGRLAIEDALVELRDARISTIRNNGLVIKERTGEPSSTIRMGSEMAVAIALKAIARVL